MYRTVPNDSVATGLCCSLLFFPLVMFGPHSTVQYSTVKILGHINSGSVDKAAVRGTERERQKKKSSTTKERLVNE